jgi:ribonuclease P protein component
MTVPPARRPCWWGAVVAQAHARRAVTRTLLKRQIRAAMQRQASVAGWPVGGAPARTRSTAPNFPAPPPSRCAARARDELDRVLADAVRRVAIR